MIRDLLIIFTRNPERGKVKTRLSSTIGPEAALRVYNFLLEHTRNITQELKVDKRVYYSDKIDRNDIWKEKDYTKRLQYGFDLGDRMQHAIQEGLDDGYTNIIIIGSDLYDLSQLDLENAFEALRRDEMVIGPALDGGYYLIGMKQVPDDVFKNKKWGSESVLRDTLQNLNGKSVTLLPEKNDIDHIEDLEQFEALKNLI